MGNESSRTLAPELLQNRSEIIARLPPPEPTIYPYELVTVENRIAFVAGQIPKRHGTLFSIGPVGKTVSVSTAAKAARVCAEQALAWLHVSCGGLDNVKRILRVTCFVAHEDGFRGISDVADGASLFLNESLGHAGRHARSVIGVKSLPRDAPVLLEITAALNEAPRLE